jgi:hypothetical protein
LPALARFRDVGYAYRFLLDGDHVPLAFGGLEIVPPGTFDSPARIKATLNLGHLLGVANPRIDLKEARERRKP